MRVFRNWSSWRRMRYAIVTGASIAPIWFLAVSYMLFAPPKYDASMTLILPGDGPTASLTLDQVGQASTHSSSPWSSSRLSPVEGYRKLMMTGTVKRRAAETREVDPDSFPTPKIKLVDQTNLMMITLRGDSKDDAEANANAFLDAFNVELNTLRTNYTARRESANRSAIEVHEEAVMKAQNALLDFRARTGISSDAQYGQAQALVENLQGRLREVESKQVRLSGEVSGLEQTLRTSASEAAIALKLSADPVFQDLLKAAGIQKIEFEAARATFGPNHPDYLAIVERLKTTLTALRSRGRSITGLSPEVFSTADLAAHGEREKMLATLVGIASRRDGLIAEQAILNTQLTTALQEIERLALPSSQFERLARDLQIAEAVFASALARADTTKTDLFGTYPLAQVVEYPLASDKPVSPSKKIGMISAIAGTVFVVIGLMLAWLRGRILRALGRMFAHPSKDPEFQRKDPIAPDTKSLDDEPLVEIPNQIPIHERYAFEEKPERRNDAP